MTITRLEKVTSTEEWTLAWCSPGRTEFADATHENLAEAGFVRKGTLPTFTEIYGTPIEDWRKARNLLYEESTVFNPLEAARLVVHGLRDTRRDLEKLKESYATQARLTEEYSTLADRVVAENKALESGNFGFVALRQISEKLGCGHGNAEILRAIDAILSQRDAAYRTINDRRVYHPSCLAADEKLKATEQELENARHRVAEVEMQRDNYQKLANEKAAELIELMKRDEIYNKVILDQIIERNPDKYKVELTAPDDKTIRMSKPLVRITREGNVIRCDTSKVISWLEDGDRQWSPNIDRQSLVRLEADKLVATWEEAERTCRVDKIFGSSRRENELGLARYVISLLSRELGIPEEKTIHDMVGAVNVYMKNTEECLHIAQRTLESFEAGPHVFIEGEDPKLIAYGHWEPDTVRYSRNPAP